MKLFTSSLLFAQILMTLVALPGQAATIDPSTKSRIYSKIHSECIDSMLSTEADFDTKNTICGCTAKYSLQVMENTFKESQVFVAATYTEKGRKMVGEIFRGNVRDVFDICLEDFFNQKIEALKKERERRPHTSHSVIIMPSPQANIQSPAANSVDPTCALARASGLDWCDTTIEFRPRYRPEWQFIP